MIAQQAKHGITPNTQTVHITKSYFDWLQHFNTKGKHLYFFSLTFPLNPIYFLFSFFNRYLSKSLSINIFKCYSNVKVSIMVIYLYLVKIKWFFFTKLISLIFQSILFYSLMVSCSVIRCRKLTHSQTFRFLSHTSVVGDRFGR